jgi:iron complex transport system ATP-binding protein
MNALLSARGLNVVIGETCVVSDFELDVAPGERIAVLGRNGVGKSTLLAALAGLLDARAGTLSLAGRALPEWPARALARQRAWMPQSRDDSFPASVLDTVLVGRHPWLGRFDWEGEEDFRIAEAALAELGLAELAGRDVTRLSGGERSRVALAAALAQCAPLMLLDEPLAHLDPARQMEVLQALQRRSDAGGACIVVLHDINIALRAFTQVLCLFGDGRWQLLSPQAAADPVVLQAAFGFPFRALDDAGRPYFLPA